jgi:hypothetical protein
VTRDRASETFADILERAADRGPVRWAAGGWTCRCPLPDRHRRGDQHPSCRLIPNRRGLAARCLGCGAGWRDIVRALGTSERDWFHDRHDDRRAGRMSHRGPQPRPVARYDYRDAAGHLVATKTRLEPGYHGKAKTFVWDRPIPEDIRLLCGVPDGADAVAEGPGCLDAGWFVPSVWGDGSWHFRAGDENQERAVLLPRCLPGLFRLPEMLATDAEKVGVVMVEGEKAVLFLTDLGFTATCPPDGANTWRPEMAEPFKGRRVLLVPDHNYVGTTLMECAAGSLMRVGVSDLRVLWPGRGGYDPPEGGGIDDWLKREHPGRPAKTLREAMKAAIGQQGHYLFHPPGG